VDIPEVVQATFYTMAATYAEEIGVLATMVGETIEEVMGLGI